jgi:hypothetical protein
VTLDSEIHIEPKVDVDPKRSCGVAAATFAAVSITEKAPVFGTVKSVFLRVGDEYDIISDADAFKECIETNRIRPS